MCILMCASASRIHAGMSASSAYPCIYPYVRSLLSVIYFAPARLSVCIRLMPVCVCVCPFIVPPGHRSDIASVCVSVCLSV